MGRTGRLRSMSGGSSSEMNNGTPSVTKCHRKLSFDSSSVLASSASTASDSPHAARQLMEILLQIRDSCGRGLLHKVTNDMSLLKAADLLLQRAQQVDATGQLLHQFLSQTDLESGYTPLHWAILHGQLPVILLLLRFPHERFSQRPMQILSEKHDSDSDGDWEGLTPFRLLSQMQVKTLAKIRLGLPKPRITVPTARSRSQTSRRTSSFSIEDENEDDFGLLRRGMNALAADDLVDDDPDASHWGKVGACEVMAFGSANHPALGLSDTTRNAHQTNRPQRVQEFALAERRDDPAVQVAAAQYHSLILTKHGDVYACGLGKGGRLGAGGGLEQPLPTRVLGALSKRKVVFVAAAENHSLCVTKEGHVFSWGSNRFGQLDASPSTSIRATPARVNDLRRPCVAVAAGDRHSVALSSSGEVFTWGDNSSGQLGRNRKNGIERVDALWNSEKFAIQVAASEQSTVVLIAPSFGGLPVNSVYSWGHGNPVPLKVTFEGPSPSTSHRRAAQVSPVSIACAKHHNVASTEDGKVFTWGIHAEPLALTSRPSSLVVASLVTGMLPENGGGVVVSVSCSDQRTAVVTAEGHLWVWGAANSGEDIMGHDGIRWQPSPKRVPAVHRAISVAVAKEHTVLLVGTSFPAIPPTIADSSLESRAASTVCDHVDMFNCVPLSIMAERCQSRLLIDYCRHFVVDNLDGILTLGRKSEMDVYLNGLLLESRVKQYRDADAHPMFMQVIMHGNTEKEWIKNCHELLARIPMSALVKYQLPRPKFRRSSFEDKPKAIVNAPEEQQTFEAGFQGCSERCLMLTANICSLKSDEEVKSKHECLTREVRGIKKRLTQITKLQNKKALSGEEREKIARKPLLDADLAFLFPAISKVEKLMRERNLEFSRSIQPKQEMNEKARKRGNFDEGVPAQQETELFRCDVCQVTCPDATHLTLHKNGRKHRNRVKQAEDEVIEVTTNTVLKDTEDLAVKDSSKLVAGQGNDRAPWNVDSVQPRYQLPPPPIRPPPTLVDTKRQGWDSTTATYCSQKKTRPSDFRSIVAEEEKRRSDSQERKVPPSTSQPLLSPGTVIPPLKNAPWATASTAQVPTPGKKPNLVQNADSVPTPSPFNSGKKKSLGEFLQTQTPIKPSPKSPVSPWASQPATLRRIPAMALPSNSKSLLEIQQEEEILAKKKSPHAAKEGKWFVEQVDRADSFSAIQEAEEHERELRLIIEEQKRIEVQIAKEQNHKQARNIRSSGPKCDGKKSTRSKKPEIGRNQQPKTPSKQGERTFAVSS